MSEIESLKKENAELRDRLQENQNIINENVRSLNHSFSDLSRDYATLSNDVDWLKRTYWIVVSSSVAGLLTGIMSMIFVYK